MVKNFLPLLARPPPGCQEGWGKRKGELFRRPLPLIPTFLVGKRDTATAHRFVQALRARLNGNGRIQLTTDGLRAYLTAVEEAFGADLEELVHAAQAD